MHDATKPLLSVRLILLFTALALTSCAPAPLDEFRVYREAFQDAARAGETLLDKVAPFITAVSDPAAAKRRTDCAKGGRAYPRAFCPDVALIGDEANEANSVRARRLAYRAIGRYNAILADFAEGKAPDQLRDQANELLAIVDLLAPIVTSSAGLPPALSLVTGKLRDVVGRIAAAQQAEAMRAGIIEGAPVVKELLGLMQQDTADIYAVFLRSKQREADKLSDAIGDARAQGSQDTVKNLQASQAAIAAEINAFHESLGHYVRLIDKTQKALDVLVVAASSRPQSDLAYLRQVIAVSIDIRNEAEAFRRSLRALG